MALPLLLGLAAPSLATAAGITGLSALGAGAIGTGIGSFIETGDLEEGIASGLTAYFGGKALGSIFSPGTEEAVKTGVDTATTTDAAAKGADAISNLDAVTPPRLETAAQMQFDKGLPGPRIDTLNMAQNLPPVPPAQAALSNITIDPQAITGSLFAESMRLPPLPEEEEKEDYDFTPTEPFTVEARYPGQVSSTGQEFVYFNEGGLMSLKGGGFPDLSGDGETTMKDVLIGRGVINKREGGVAPNDKDIIIMAVDAIKGKSNQPEIALGRFVERYGEDSLEDLVVRVRTGEFDDNAQRTEGKVNGAGDGMDDMIPASLEGEQDVVLSDGEFIVPADVVSGLGNGSSDAGSKRLYEMMDRVRKLRTGDSEQPEQVSPERMLPA